MLDLKGDYIRAYIQFLIDIFLNSAGISCEWLLEKGLDSHPNQNF